jgi:hypothetical protein
MAYSPQFGKSTTLKAQLLTADTTGGDILSSAVFTNFTGDFLVIDYDNPSLREVIKCTVTGTSVSSITRAQDGTSAHDHAIGAKVAYNFVPSHYTALGKIAAGDAWTDWTPTGYKSDGTTALTLTVAKAKYQQIGKLVYATISGSCGDPSGVQIYFTLPVAAKQDTNNLVIGAGRVNDGAAKSGYILILANQNGLPRQLFG